MYKINRFILCLIFLQLVFSFNSIKANAAYMTALDLIKFCTSNNKEQNKLCYGYIAGIIDYHNLTKSLGTAPTVNFCAPNHMKISEVTNRIIKYLRSSPQHDQFIAAPAVALALFKEFPCKMPKPTRKRK